MVGHYLYVSCDSGLVVLDIDDPLNPKITSVLAAPNIKMPRFFAAQFRYGYVCDDEGIKVLDLSDLAKPVAKAMIRLHHAHSIYLARTYAYVAAGPNGLVILDITKAEEPKVDQVFTADGCMNDVHDVKLAIAYNSQMAYIADGHNGLRVVQLTSPETPGYEGFSPKPTPRLIATFRPKHGEVLSVARALDRDRAVDEDGNQIGVFGRIGARPLNGPEQRRMWLRNGLPWFVSDDPKDAMYLKK